MNNVQKLNKCNKHTIVRLCLMSGLHLDFLKKQIHFRQTNIRFQRVVC
jgi:hypothetical protein